MKKLLLLLAMVAGGLSVANMVHSTPPAPTTSGPAMCGSVDLAPAYSGTPVNVVVNSGNRDIAVKDLAWNADSYLWLSIVDLSGTLITNLPSLNDPSTGSFHHYWTLNTGIILRPNEVLRVDQAGAPNPGLMFWAAETVQ